MVNARCERCAAVVPPKDDAQANDWENTFNQTGKIPTVGSAGCEDCTETFTTNRVFYFFDEM